MSRTCPTCGGTEVSLMAFGELDQLTEANADGLYCKDCREVHTEIIT